MKKKIQEKVMCEICSTKEAANVHHKDQNNKNNKVENLQNLCVPCHNKIHGNIPRFSQLRHYVDLREREINIKVHLSNTIKGLSDAELLTPPELTTLKECCELVIKDYEELIKAELDTGNYPIWDQFLKNIKGISYNTAAFLISHIDISKSPHVSSLWRYCGLDATRVRRKSGKGKDVQVWNNQCGSPILKKEILGIIGENFIKQKTPIYRDIYDSVKKSEIELAKKYGLGVIVPGTENDEHPKTTIKIKTTLNAEGKEQNGHASRRATRKMMKIFMENYWSEDRKLHNLPVTQPYVQAKLGHTHIIKPHK